MLKNLSGKKTYIIAVLTILYAIFGYWQGHMEFDDAMQMILGGAGLGALRAGVTKGQK